MTANQSAIHSASQTEKDLAVNQPQPRQESGDGFMDEKQLLARLPICRRTAFTWIRQGKLPCVKIGRRKLFHWPSVETALLRQQRGGATE